MKRGLLAGGFVLVLLFGALAFFFRPQTVQSNKPIDRINVHAFGATETKPYIDCSPCHAAKEPVKGGAALKPTVSANCLGCHDSMKIDPKTVLVTAHSDCTDCHGLHQPTGMKPNLTGDALCLACHEDFAKQRTSSYAHQPFVNSPCASCHDPHGRTIKGLLRVDQKELCAGCHKAIINAELAKPVKHQPFAEGACTWCHSPHGSEEEHGLTLKPYELCLTCHNPNSDRFSKFPHKGHLPFEFRICLSCHQPHASEYPSLSRAAPGGGLCTICHAGSKR